MTSRVRIFLAICACALVAVPSVAAARPENRGNRAAHRTFERTFPHASHLCSRVASGHTPKKLASSSDQVAAACADLKSAFTTARNAFMDKFEPLKAAAKDAIAKAHQSCKDARAAGDEAGATCKQARQDARATLKDLRTQLRTALKAYHGDVKLARQAFWTTVKGLRGGSSETSDSGPGPDPSGAELPADSQA